jgi:hypothetical protein
MNKEQQELLDEAYEKYLEYTINGIETGLDKIKGYLDGCLVEYDGYYEHFTNPSFAYGYRTYNQEEFINKCKTDSEFSERWGLRIKERELKKNSGWERYELLLKRISEKELQEKYKDDERATWIGFRKFTLVNANYICDKENIPTKQITIAYNNKTIESYE